MHAHFKAWGALGFMRWFTTKLSEERETTLEDDNLSLRIEESRSPNTWNEAEDRPRCLSQWLREADFQQVESRERHFSREELSSSKSCPKRKRYVTKGFLALGVQAVLWWLIGLWSQLCKYLIYNSNVDIRSPKASGRAWLGMESWAFRLTISIDWVSEQISLAELRGFGVFGAFFESLWVRASASCPPSIHFPPIFLGIAMYSERNQNLHFPSPSQIRVANEIK